MKLKRLLTALLALAVTLTCAACTAKTDTISATTTTTNPSGGSDATPSASSAAIAAQDSAYFADGDLKDVTAETPNATVTLSGSTGTISDTTRGSSGETVTIMSKGVYRVTGRSQNVSIVINDATESGNVYLVLDGVTMQNATAPCLIVEAADKVIVQCVGENSLTYTAASADYDGAIYAKDDLTVNGSGSLTVNSTLHGIVCKDDLKITGAAISITAGSIGLKANDSVRIGGGAVSITAGHDGVQVKSDDGTGYFYMEAGTLSVTAGYDGIDVGTDEADGADAETYSGYVLIQGGSVSVTAGGGSSSSKNASTSQKGIKCDGDVRITGTAAVTVSSADDALHSATNIDIESGTVELSSSDDGIHADNRLTVSGGTVTVSQSYEGLEAYEVTVSGGTVSVVASDDGINAAGGSDTTSTDTRPGMWGASGSGILTISGGNLYVNARGDGLDSNGSIYVTGGTVIVEGPTDNGNGALDKGEGGDCVASITGGTVLAIGSTGMAVGFDTGTQCAALVGLSGSAGTTITVDDGSGFTFTTTKAFSCIVYSSPSLTQGNTYTVTAGGSSATMDFTSGLYYSTVSGMGGGMGGPGGNPGGMTPPPGGFGRP